MSEQPRRVEPLCPSCREVNAADTNYCRYCGACMSCGTQDRYHTRLAAAHGTPTPTPPKPAPKAPPSVHTPSAPPPVGFASGKATPRPSSVVRRVWQTCVLVCLCALVGIILFYTGGPEVSVPAVAAAATPTPEVPLKPEEAPAADGAPVLNVKDAERYTEPLKDGSGRVLGEVEFLLLADEDVWVAGSETDLEQIGNIFEKGAAAFGASLLRDLRESPELVNFGAADSVGKRAREEDRSDARGRNMKKVLTRDVKQSGGTVHYVELGQWAPSRDQRCLNVPRAAQRRIVIGRVNRTDENADLGPPLRDALSRLQNKHEVFKDILTCYTESDVFRLR
jgi:hypothetical protein